MPDDRRSESASAEPRFYRHTRHLTVLQTAAATVIALGVLLTPTWEFMLEPLLTSSVQSAMAEDLQERVDESVARQLRPLKKQLAVNNAGVEALIQGNIQRLEDEISELEYLRDFGEADEWTDDRQRSLLKKQRALAAQQRALEAIRNAHN